MTLIVGVWVRLRTADEATVCAWLLVRALPDM